MDNNHIPHPRSVNVGELLPQRPPFVLVDALLHFDERTATCCYRVPEDGIFTDNGRLSAAGLMENVAQTCAARLGFHNKYVLKCAVQLGFIGGIRNFNIRRLPRVGEVIVTSINVEENVMGMTLASAVVKSGDETLATTQIKIALMDGGVKK